jgi:phage/conjugal plasmid C-4 type zinc finger TraR family protein
VADDMDIAQAINEQHLEDALAAHRRKTSEALKTSEVCEDCKEPIPAARLAAMPGCTRCIDCQTTFERRHP